MSIQFHQYEPNMLSIWVFLWQIHFIITPINATQEEVIHFGFCAFDRFQTFKSTSWISHIQIKFGQHDDQMSRMLKREGIIAILNVTMAR